MTWVDTLALAAADGRISLKNTDEEIVKYVCDDRNLRNFFNGMVMATGSQEQACNVVSMRMRQVVGLYQHFAQEK